MGTQYDIVSIGSIYLDINSPNFPFQEQIDVESEIVGGSYILTPGGSALNFAKVSSFLGLKPVFVGKIGSDSQGEVLQQLIQQTGITPALIKSGAVQTNIGINFINPSGQIFTASVGTANQDLNDQEVSSQLKTYLPQSKFLYIAGYFKLKQLIPHYPQIITMAKEAGVKIILDHGRAANIATPDERSALLSLIKDVDIYLPNIDEVLDLWQAEDLNYAAQRVQATTNALLVVKQAQKGATGLDNNKLVPVPAFPVAPISTVGAGDSFNAGFIYAHIAGNSLSDSIRYANATAALAISNKSLPTSDQVTQFLSTHTNTTPTSPTSTQPPTSSQ